MQCLRVVHTSMKEANETEHDSAVEVVYSRIKEANLSSERDFQETWVKTLGRVLRCSRSPTNSSAHIPVSALNDGAPV